MSTALLYCIAPLALWGIVTFADPRKHYTRSFGRYALDRLERRWGK